MTDDDIVSRVCVWIIHNVYESNPVGRRFIAAWHILRREVAP
jgi:hypothetical protein